MEGWAQHRHGGRHPGPRRHHPCGQVVADHGRAGLHRIRVQLLLHPAGDDGARPSPLARAWPGRCLVPWKPSHVLHRCAAGLAAWLCCAASTSVHGMRPRAPTSAETRCALGAQDTVRAPENKPMRKAVGVSVWITTFFYIAIGIFGCAGHVGCHACHCSALTRFMAIRRVGGHRCM